VCLLKISAKHVLCSHKGAMLSVWHALCNMQGWDSEPDSTCPASAAGPRHTSNAVYPCMRYVMLKHTRSTKSFDAVALLKRVLLVTLFLCLLVTMNTSWQHDRIRIQAQYHHRLYQQL
jgi:hypothetical protein